MVCRSTPGNSAITTMARNTSNLHDVQVLSLFHETRADAPRNRPAPSAAERARFLREHSIYATHNYPNMPERRRRDLLNRIQEARETDVDGRTYYAWQNIEQRAMFARAAMDTHFSAIGRRFGFPPSEVEAAFNRMMARDHRIGDQVPEAPANLPFHTTHLPRDRGTRYALAMLHASGPEVTTDSALAIETYEGIHATSQHLADNPERNPANHCADCGQFADDDHVCPHLVDLNQSYSDWIAQETPQISPEDAATLAGQSLIERGLARMGATPGHNYTPLDYPGLRDNLAAITEQTNGQWVATDGTPFVGRTAAVRHQRNLDTEAVLRSRIADHAERNPADVDELIADARARISQRDTGDWVTTDRRAFWRSEDAVFHQYLRDNIHDGTDLVSTNSEGEATTRCADCGQYAGARHVCLTATPEEIAAAEALEAWENELLAEQAREAENENISSVEAETPVFSDAELAVAPAPTGAPAMIPTYPPGEEPLAEWERELLMGADIASAPVEPVRRRNPMRSYRADDTTVVRTMNMSAVRADLRNNPTCILRDVTVDINEDLADGQSRQVSVTGSVEVTNTGQRRTRSRDRYTVAAEPSTYDSVFNPEDRPLRCTCPDYRANYDCIHIRQATEHIAALVNQREPVAVAPAEAMTNVGAALRDEYDAALSAAQDARADFDAAASHDISYADNMSAFQASWDEAKTHFDSGDQSLPYMYENATNGLGVRGEGGRSIGIEIEVDFPDDMSYTAKARVAQEIYDAGLSDSPQVRPWHWRARATGPRGQSYGGGYTDNPNMWSVEHDSSVDDVGGRRGCEIVSPILYDTPETWRNLEKVCEIVQRNGGRVTPRTGLHINIGAADFDHTVANHNRLIGLANAYEDVIVRTAHNPASGPNHRGRDYCRPMTMPEQGFTSIRQAQRSIDPQNYEGSSHRAMINLDHVPAEGAPVQNSTRVEVRIFDGSIDPGRIQANVNLSLGMVNAAVRGVDVPRNHERAGTHRNANVGSNGRMRRLRGEAWENDTATFRRFADTIFTTPEQKRQLTFAFAASRWQRR